MNYNPYDWYWLADDGQLFSSKRSTFIDKNDAAYKAWLNMGNKPTRWPVDLNGNQTDAELCAVLLPYSLAGPVSSLSAIKDQLKAKTDTEAETERLKYITPGTGQAMTYQQKVAEAQAFKAASNPKPADYPILASEVGITAPTLSEVADTVLNAYHQWQQIGAMIEAIRLGAKRDIDASTTEAAARAVVDSVSWPQPIV